MRDVAGVNHERLLRRQRLHPPDRLFQPALGVGVGRLVKTHVAVANLQEAEALALLWQRLIDHADRRRHYAGDGPQHSGSRPGHTLELLAASWTFAWTFGCAFIVIVSGHTLSPLQWLHGD